MIRLKRNVTFPATILQGILIRDRLHIERGINFFFIVNLSRTGKMHRDSIYMTDDRVRRMFEKPWILPVATVLLAVSIRALFLLFASDMATFRSPGMDAEVYQDWAQYLLAGESMEQPYFRAPLYPWLISLLAYLFSGDTFWPVRIFQVLFSGFAAAALGKTAATLFRSRSGWIAGIAWALYGISVYFDAEGLIVSLFTSLLILLIFLIVHVPEKPLHRYLWLLALGLICGLLAGLRANGLIWWPVVLLYLFFHLERSSLWRRALGALLPFVIAGFLISPILYHNLHTGGGLTISTQGGINLFLGNHPDASGAFAVDPDFGESWTREQMEVRAVRDEGRPLTAAEIDRYYRNRALRFWIESPGEALALLGRKILILLNHEEVGNNRVFYPYLRAVHPAFVYLAQAGFPLLLLLSIPGLISGLIGVERFRWLLALAGIHAAVVVLFFVSARYRFPVTPVLTIGLAGTVAMRKQWIRPLKQRGIKRYLLVASYIACVLLVFLPSPLPRYTQMQADWLYHQGNAKLRLGEVAEARDLLYHTLAEDPNYRNAHLNIGVTFLRSGEIDSAVRHFARESELHPSNAKALNNLGVISERRGNLELARRYYRDASYSRLADQDARLNYARLLNREAVSAARSQRSERALVLLQEAIQFAPEKPEYALNLALVYADRGQYTEAGVLLDSLVNRYPDYRPASEALRSLESMISRNR